jgi:hypothetical protein
MEMPFWWKKGTRQMNYFQVFLVSRYNLLTTNDLTSLQGEAGQTTGEGGI